MTSNFSFLVLDWKELSSTLLKAERQVYADPEYTAALCRKSLEEWIRWLYEHDADLTLPYDTSLNSLLHQPELREFLGSDLISQLNLVRKQGNDAVHTKRIVKPEHALHVLQIMHGFAGWVFREYNDNEVAIPAFDVTLVPTETPAGKYKDQIQKLEEEFKQTQALNRKLQDELDRVKAAKESHTKLPPPTDPNEELTRKLYIDLLLKEAGWDPHGHNVAEYTVTGMPTGSGRNDGTGRVDYTLWGDDGKPLAVVEAKRTSKDPKVGQHQAKLYANCLEQMHGQRPVIFYTNGFETWLWDDTEYPPRRVHGFYKKDELQRLIQRRISRTSLLEAPVNPTIADRHYQIEAIRSVGKVLHGKGRSALLVMATGTGKTRTAAALIEVLSKCNWVKRALILADRTSLIYQAKNAFTNCVSHLPAVDLTREKDQPHARLVFCTYQTMINLIDQAYENNQRYFGVGQFDLIIFDEIHRSVYNRYKAIFEYFDGYRIGLTATPKSEGDRDTYHLFGLEPHNPTFAYELEQAVEEGFLVPPLTISVPVKFHREGIKYADLTPKEKKQYEEKFYDPVTGEFPDEIDSGALNTWLFNEGTVRKVLAYLMQHGIKVAGGDRIAKTIIFARSHNHAKFIEEIFDKEYPQYKGDYCKVIDNYEEYAHDILKKFSGKENAPHIAISVDMLDTGIDVPEVANLVFYKPVKSWSKFWQMIGRGTRLCPDLFGPGQHKENFLIFDLCENFEFFGTKPKGNENQQGKSLTQRLFEQRLRLSFHLQKKDEDEYQHYAQELLTYLHKQVAQLNDTSFMVMQHWREVEKYRDIYQWNALNDLNLKELLDHIGPLVFEKEEDELAKRFDLLCISMEGELLQKGSVSSHRVQEIRALAASLSKRGSIPMVNAKMALIKQVQSEKFWGTDPTLQKIEHVRKKLRSLIRFIETSKKAIVFTDLDDSILEEPAPKPVVVTGLNLDAYKKKVTEYLQQNKHHLTIHKLRTNQEITISDLIALEHMLFDQGQAGNREQFEKAYGKQPLGKFVRSIVGLDTASARTLFSKFINDPGMNPQQIRFVNTIIDYLSTNGIIEVGKLFETPPFTDISSAGILGVFSQQQTQEVVSLLEQVNRYADVG